MARPAAVLLDFDDTLIDNTVVPAAVERACHSIAAAVDSVDAAALLRANTAAWVAFRPGVEGRCWLLVDRVHVTLFPAITGQTGLDPIFQGGAAVDLELLENRTLDGRTQELIYRPTLD
jgi:hypothetical protein